MAKRKHNDPSRVLLEEYFAAQDDRFIDLLYEFQNDKYLATFVNRWTSDQRTWSRDQVLVYLQGNMNLPGHEVVFKRLYKHFLHQRDHEVMGAFMVTLDRMVRRSYGSRSFYDWQSRQYITREFFRAKPNQSIHELTDRKASYTWSGRTHEYPLPDLLNRPGNVLFSHRTRNYLRRSAWRYFRFLSYREPDVYLEQICQALARYEDKDLLDGEAILDNWGLMHACYFGHEAIEFTNSHTNLAAGRSLNELTPAPYQPELWKSSEATQHLLKLLVDANSTLVRIWTIELLQRDHQDSLKSIELSTLVTLMASPDTQLQQFAMELFQQHPSLPTLMVERWLELLDECHVSLLSMMCDAMREHVSAERLTNQQLLQLSCAQQQPLAQSGFELLQDRDQTKPLGLAELKSLVDCQCVTLSGQITTWALERITDRESYSSDNVIDFFDALNLPMRKAALNWLDDQTNPAYQDPRLWAQLIESPFDEIRLGLVEMLQQRVHRSSDQTEAMAPVWVAIILGIQRGSRTKPKAIHQIGQQLIDNQGQADQLLPVLGVALRSPRAPERRAAVACLAQLASESTELKTNIESTFPELEFDQEALECR